MDTSKTFHCNLVHYSLFEEVKAMLWLIGYDTHARLLSNKMIKTVALIIEKIKNSRQHLPAQRDGT